MQNDKCLCKRKTKETPEVLQNDNCSQCSPNTKTKVYSVGTGFLCRDNIILIYMYNCCVIKPAAEVGHLVTKVSDTCPHANVALRVCTVPTDLKSLSYIYAEIYFKSLELSVTLRLVYSPLSYV